MDSTGYALNLGRLSGWWFPPRGADQPHLPESLEDDGAGHLALADAAVGEDDGDFHHPEAGAQGPVRQLDLEGVAGAGYGGQIDSLQHFAAEALEAAGEVVHADAQDGARVDAPAAREQAPSQAPVAGPAPGDVPAA